jgi:predicted dehydrogenase
MSSTQELVAGVVGTGFMGTVHIEALRRLGVPVAGVVGSTPERASAKARELHLPVYASLESLLADTNVQVVHITSPNSLHYPQARAALEAGKHVICEKPLAMNSQQAAELAALATSRRLAHAVNFNNRCYPLIQQARALRRSGELGRIYTIQGSYLQDWQLYVDDWNWRMEAELVGGTRMVGDTGSHWLDLVEFVTGDRVAAVMAELTTFLPVRLRPARPGETTSDQAGRGQNLVAQPVATEDYAAMLLRFASGARGSLALSAMCAGHKNRLFFEIDGAGAALAWDSERANELWVGRRERPNEHLVRDRTLMSPEVAAYASYPRGNAEGFHDSFKQLYREIYAYIAAGDPAAPASFPTFADGLHSLQLGESIHRSAQECRWVDVPE